MSDEKAHYVSKADKRKKDYKKNMDAYNKKLAQGTNASEDKNEESNKSRSEANDEDDKGSEGSGEVYLLGEKLNEWSRIGKKKRWVGKAGGVKWKSMSDVEKAPYVSKADKRKKDYKKNMDAYKKKLAQGTNASEDKNEESDKSRSEANDEDDEGSEGSGEVEDSEYFWWILYDWRALLMFGGFYVKHTRTLLFFPQSKSFIQTK